MEKTILDDLQEKLNFAVAKMREMQRANQMLKQEIKKLYTQIAEQDKYIETLKQGVSTPGTETTNDQIRQYQDTEEKVRKKISEMLAKLDSLHLTEEH
ncbi:hypothetical protein JXO59_16075 [candidate division KSB1 bacterium]|nr:hypothetical protein [candidate division KSB1 bacterium]